MAANPNNPTEAQSIQALRDAAEANLNGAVPNWLNTLKGVRDEEFPGLAGSSLSNTVLEDIVAECNKVAKKYIDIAPIDNIRAACTLPPGVVTASGYGSFMDVFMDKVPGITRTNGFNEDLLGDPYSYTQTAFASSPNIFEINTTLCTNLTTLKNKWISAGSPGTLHTWLQQQLKEDYILTEAQLTELQTKCLNNIIKNRQYEILSD